MATVVRYRPNSLVCMYTNARTGVRRAVYGSLAERLLRRTDAPSCCSGRRGSRRAWSTCAT